MLKVEATSKANTRHTIIGRVQEGKCVPFTSVEEATKVLTRIGWNNLRFRD